MIYVRMAESANHAGFSFVCDSVTEAMALSHYYVWRGSQLRCAEIINTSVPFPLLCGINYTRMGSFDTDVINDKGFEYMYNVSLF